MNPATIAVSIAPAQIRPFAAWWSVFIFVVFNIVSLIDRNVIAVMIPEIQADLGLNDFQISLVQGMAFALFYGLVGLLIGGLVDRYPRRWIMYGGISLWSLAAAGAGLAANYAQMFLARMLVGMGEGAISPAAQSLLAGIFPRHRLATPLSAFVAAGIVGIGLSFALGGWLLEYFADHPLGGPFAGLAPWRQVLIALGLPGLLIALLAFTVHEPARPMLAAGAQQPSWKSFFAHFRANPRLIGGLLAGYGLTAMISHGSTAWAPTYARRVLGLSAGAVGETMFLIVAVGGVASTIAMGMLVDRLTLRGCHDAPLRCFLAAAILAIPAAATGFLADNVVLLYLGIAVMVCTLSAAFGPGLAAVQMISPPEMRGRMGALIVLVTNIGGFALGPMMVGALTDYVFRDEQWVGVSIATLIVIVGSLATLIIWHVRPAFARRVSEG